MRRFLLQLLVVLGLPLLAISLLPKETTAQGGTVRGHVADSAGAAIAQAVVTIEPGGLRATTRDNGDYAVTHVPGGVYTVRVRRLGYVTPPTSITIAEGQTVTQNFTLTRSVVSLAEVVIGSRARHTAADELPVPVDVFTPEMIQAQGTTETAQILSQLSPSVNFPRQSVSDATEIVRPFTMRGLSPDHTLVLINGKRRHHTALIHYYGAGEGAGSSGIDMNSIPASAVGGIEVLRDGAAAQYGSDAIAGVVNILLKDGTVAPFLNADLGEYFTSAENPAALPNSNGSRPSYPRDGRTFDVNGGWGIPLGRGSLGLFAEYRDRQPTNRAGPDPTDMFVTGDADGVVDGNLVAKNNSIPMPNHHWGDGASKDLMTFFNASFPFSPTNASTGLYAFGGYSYRQGAGFGYFRPPSSARNWPQIYPNGFLPKFAPKVLDFSGAGGVRGVVSGWSYDLGGTIGHNGFKYDLENTLNTSLGPCLTTACAPGADGVLGTADDPGIPNKTSIFAGELKYTEAIASLDASHEYAVGLASPLNVAVGTAFRKEWYVIGAGEAASYVNGFYPAQDGGIAPSGSQVFPGFRPQDATNAERNNVGAYADLEADLVPRVLADVAARYEHYSDFGSKVTGKLAMRYQPTPRLTLRSAASTGFRAPSLNQSFYSSVVTNFAADPNTGNPVPFEIGIFPVNSRESRALGARPLKPESSRNFSAGFALTPVDNLTLTSDLYYIAIDDRITITGFLGDGTDSVSRILANIGSPATTAQYFTNAIDTRTRGLDITGNYSVETLGGTAGLNAVFNFTRTTIPNEDNIPLPAELEGTGVTLVNKYDEGGLLAITKERPAWRTNLTGTFGRGAWNGMVRYSYYGKYTSALYSYSGSDVQNYRGKSLVDAEIGFAPIQGFKLSIGGRNLFDVYPDRMNEGNGFDIFPWPPASPFGYNGRFLYTRLEVTGR